LCEDIDNASKKANTVVKCHTENDMARWCEVVKSAESSLKDSKIARTEKAAWRLIEIRLKLNITMKT
jgi:hypothetical protein